MSHGALSAEAHETLAIAFNRLGGRSNCGEGGEDPARFRDERNSRIKQVASGRFGVTAEYVAFADELQIKIAQGSKPGEGGQLPATRSPPRSRGFGTQSPASRSSRRRRTTTSTRSRTWRSSIFDLSRSTRPRRLGEARRGGGRRARRGGRGQGAGRRHPHRRRDGGTGASPLPSIKNAGVPWELGLAETQQALVANGLRGRVRLRVDGGLKTGRDVIVAALLGADEVWFGTALLLAEGCLMVRSCHLDTCPVGIATQRPELRSKFAATPAQVEAYLLHLAEDVRRHLAALGLRSFGEAVGRVECLRRRRLAMSARRPSTRRRSFGARARVTRRTAWLSSMSSPGVSLGLGLPQPPRLPSRPRASSSSTLP